MTVVAAAVGWCEGELPAMQSSLFTTFNAYDPMWPTKLLFGVGGAFDIASLRRWRRRSSAACRTVHAERHRYVHVFGVVAEENGRRRRHNLAVFLTESDAEVAKRLVEPHAASDRPN